MAGRAEPPEGNPGGVPGAGDDEYKSTVFDESFVKAARLEEFSAQERLEEHTTAVRSRTPERPDQSVRALPKQGIALALVILLAFATAIYLGGNNPYGTGGTAVSDPPVSSVVALAPEAEVPGSTSADALYEHSPAKNYGVGAGGVDLPDPSPTAHFSREQVLTALTVGKEYVVASSLTPEVVSGSTYTPVRDVLITEQRGELDRAVAGADPYTTTTSWLVAFDSDEVTLADSLPRVDGSFTVDEISDDVLQVTATHTIAYAVRPAGSPDASASLFTVQREVRLLFTADGLRDRQVVLRGAETLAGPMDCSADTSDSLEPLLAGEQASGQSGEGVNPYADRAERTSVCGTLAASAQPDL